VGYWHIECSCRIIEKRIHVLLGHKNLQTSNPKASSWEWFKCSPEDIEAAMATIKTSHSDVNANIGDWILANND
jgi:hypothetical protein